MPCSDSSMDDKDLPDTPFQFTPVNVQIPLWTIRTQQVLSSYPPGSLVQIPLWTIRTAVGLSL